jgi:multicomponent Na+:H+ antiporter subunit B
LRGKEAERSIIVETVSRVMIPFIQLFSLYVIIHGASGPGGGFQGGVVFGASFILYVVVFDITMGRKRLPESVNTVLSSLGLYIYAGLGLLCIILSSGVAQYLNYGFLPFTAHFEENRALGIELVEMAIGITVMAIMISIFFDLAWKEENRERREKQGLK